LLQNPLLAFADMQPIEVPPLVKWLVTIAVAVAAVVKIWKDVQGNKWAGVVMKELTNNGGSSMKDQVSRAATDSKEALDITKTIYVRQRRSLSRLLKLEKRQTANHEENTAKIEALNKSYIALKSMLGHNEAAAQKREDTRLEGDHRGQQ
jgi:hypothetical protein